MMLIKGIKKVGNKVLGKVKVGALVRNIFHHKPVGYITGNLRTIRKPSLLQTMSMLVASRGALHGVPKYAGIVTRRMSGSAVNLFSSLKKSASTVRGMVSHPSFDVSMPSGRDAGVLLFGRSFVYSLFGRLFTNRYQHLVNNRVAGKIPFRLFYNAVKHWMY